MGALPHHCIPPFPPVNCASSPSVSYYRLMQEESESAILRAIGDYLAMKKYFFWRSNNVPIFSQDRFRAMPKYSRLGIPDIILINKDGVFIGLEVKRLAKYQSKAQKEFEGELKDKTAAQYFVVRSIDDVIALGL